jgi:GMP synthase-like glutamine amidotransferase
MRLAHDEQVADLPAPLVHLARSPVGVYEAIRDGDRPVYGVQFHPEVSGHAGRVLLANFLDICATRR